MDSTDLHHVLTRWGRAFGEPPPSEWQEESSSGSGALTGVLIDFIRVGVAASGPAPFGEGKGYTALCKASAPGRREWQPDLVSEAVEVAWLGLYRHSPTQAVILRMEYCWRGSRSERVAMAAKCLGLRRMAKRVYREGLQAARDSIDDRLWSGAKR